MHACQQCKAASLQDFEYCYITKNTRMHSQYRYVKMDKCVWLEGLPLQEEWKFVLTEDGAQCVMTCGMFMMPEWSADNLDCHFHVSSD